MIVREPDAFSVQFVQMWGLEPGVSMTPQVPVALIVRHDENDVGFVRSSRMGRCNARNRKQNSGP